MQSQALPCILHGLLCSRITATTRSLKPAHSPLILHRCVLTPTLDRKAQGWEFFSHKPGKCRDKKSSSNILLGKRGETPTRVCLGNSDCLSSTEGVLVSLLAVLQGAFFLHRLLWQGLPTHSEKSEAQWPPSSRVALRARGRAGYQGPSLDSSPAHRSLFQTWPWRLPHTSTSCHVCPLTVCPFDLKKN